MGELTVTVYCGSLSTVPQSYLDLATDVGKRIAGRGWDLAWGGGKRSMMGAVAQAVRDGGRRTTGVIPRSLVEREWADSDADDLLVVETMRDRKALMEAHGDAFLALPGGIGTLEELFEVWTSRTLSMHAKPVVLLDVDGHYTGLVRWLEELRDRGFVAPAAMGVLTITDDLDAALDACAS
ncbi:LOG family protein [Actinosynnema pretiosum]|uniref:Cytokinin riboside 5'-monophosphate phosphoribohydrolase n=1 Tax=Actinosynnema pretiosum TaxID=42197 RepID=A0A290Z0I2_9PSEU|nr:TIGR00730 family Rossman fold protein [Actinosynnema pretiosum]ATE52521.1 TIGR00730 family Rossman fold protein [Actinosynnema pretiosum]